jgi:hypothetical protein
MARRLRPSFVVTVATLSASFSAAACATRCPETVHAGDSCSGSRECKLKDGCGLNGWKCENGQWREIMTYCNPPPLLPEPVPAVVDASTASSSTATASTATASTASPAVTATASVAATATAKPVATVPVGAACPAPIAAAQACSIEGQRCQEKGGCGFNGWRCDQGKWKEMRTFCNPPPLFH